MGLRKPIMLADCPHYLLSTESVRSDDGILRWRFSLHSREAGQHLTASDTENETRPSRLELLAVVRGLEAIDGPAHVTLISRSRYVVRGLRRQLQQWREHQWQYERFGKLVPIRDQDLWRRVDRALEFHHVECRVWRGGDETAASADAAWKPGMILAAALATFRRGVLTSLSALRRPTYTRAA